MALEKVGLVEIGTTKAVVAEFGSVESYMRSRTKQFQNTPGMPELVGPIRSSVTAISSGEFVRFSIEGMVEIPD